MLEQLKVWDRQLFIFLNGLGVEQYDAFWILMTQEETWIPLYLFMFFLIFKTYWKEIKKAYTFTVGVILTFAITFGFTRLVKEYVARIRPNNNETLRGIIRILQEPTYYSFFSGHTSSSMAITTYIVLIFRKKYTWIYLFYIWPFLFATSRIYVGVHYPSDIFVGALVGVIFAVVMYKITVQYIQKNIEHG